jgi:dimethylhistidine N-methyltransferase
MTLEDEGGLDRSAVLSGTRPTARDVAKPAEKDQSGARAAKRDMVAEAALAGLLAPRKTLPPSLFYDEEGCRLFYEITTLPEYYLTRTEFRLLRTTVPEVAALLPAGATLVEYGASDETKAEMLLSQTVAAPRGEMVFRTYIPIDVAAPALRAMRERLAVSRPVLSVVPVTADFMRPIELPEREAETAIMGFFPGSTIGNLEPGPAVGFLGRARDTLGPKARFLLGFDTCRDPARLIPAYDDPQGITARFNRNLLVRLNREAGATFDPETFAHRAIWNEAESRIEMHLVSRIASTVMVAGHPIQFARGESIHTENSYKFAPERMRTMVEAAGWTVSKTWSDSNGLFAIWLLD